MCGPALAWDWLVLDVAYVLVLVGGAMTLRLKLAGLGTWLLFGLLSIVVGGFLFGWTYVTQAAAVEITQQMNTTTLLAGC